VEEKNQKDGNALHSTTRAYYGYVVSQFKFSRGVLTAPQVVVNSDVWS